MAIPVTNIPILTGEAAEHFIEMCEHNASQSGSLWSKEREDAFAEYMERNQRLLAEMQR